MVQERGEAHCITSVKDQVRYMVTSKQHHSQVNKSRKIIRRLKKAKANARSHPITLQVQPVKGTKKEDSADKTILYLPQVQQIMTGIMTMAV